METLAAATSERRRGRVQARVQTRADALVVGFLERRRGFGSDGGPRGCSRRGRRAGIIELTAAPMGRNTAAAAAIGEPTARAVAASLPGAAMDGADARPRERGGNGHRAHRLARGSVARGADEPNRFSAAAPGLPSFSVHLPGRFQELILERVLDQPTERRRSTATAPPRPPCKRTPSS